MGVRAATRPEDLDAQALIQEAFEKVAIRKQGKPLPAGKYPVILDFSAVAEILTILVAAHFGGPEFHQAGLDLYGELSQQVFHELVNIWDDGKDLSGCPTWVDCEAIKIVMFIEAGATDRAYTIARTAAQYGARSTGHAQSRQNPMSVGPQSQNLFYAGREDVFG